LTVPDPDSNIFDRIPSTRTRKFAPRLFQVSDRLTTDEVRVVRNRVGPVRDQNTYTCLVCPREHGSCTGHGIVSWRSSTVYRHGLWLTEQDAHAVYHENKTLDEIPGVDYEGSTINGGALAARNRGWCDEFYWAENATELALGLRRWGAAYVGSSWHANMMRPDALGFIHPTGEVVGGHAYIVVGFVQSKTRRNREFVIQNSWGNWGISLPGFGAAANQKGLARITWEEMEDLIADDGDVVFMRSVS
jgi:hypothetical protein